MKFANVFAFAALAFGMIQSAVADEALEIELDITSSLEDKTAVMDMQPGPDVVESLEEAAGVVRRKRNRKLQTITITEGWEDEFRLNEAGDKITLISVGYDEGMVPCPNDAGGPTRTCWYIALFYRAKIEPGPFSTNVETLTFDYVAPEFKAKAKAALINHLNANFGGMNVVTGAEVRSISDIAVFGDPHFKTFGGGWYDFMGACDLKMIHAPTFDGADKPLDIDVRTKIQYDYSYVEAVAVKLGNDVLEVGSYGEYFLNGVASPQLSTFAGYPITHITPSDKVHVFQVTINERESFTIKTFKELVAINLEQNEMRRFAGALGMAGSFDKEGELLGRDGVTVLKTPDAMAAEWQIRADEPMLFNVASGPQAPAKCQMPDPSQAKGRRLGETIALSAAEKACAKWAPENKDACVHDVMAIGDLELAAAGAF